MAADIDSPLQTLWLPFEGGLLPWPRDDVLFLGARAQAAWLHPLRERLRCVQYDRVQVDALRAAGYALESEPGDDDADADANANVDSGRARCTTVLALPPRQREAARGMLAEAVARCAPGGHVVASVANDEGAKSLEADLRRLAGLRGSLSKHHCRVFWAQLDAAGVDAALLARWRAESAPQPILDGRRISRPGVFGWNKIDAGSALLAEQLPADIGGRVADLGAGWGYLAIELLQRCPRIRQLDLIDTDAHALACARRNLFGIDHAAAIEHRWRDASHGLDAQYDAIVCNPPFHAQGRADRPDLGQRFIAVAADALRTGGRLFLVANRHLPYEGILAARFASHRVLAQADGFKAIEAVK